jgi:hypothetical protein
MARRASETKAQPVDVLHSSRVQLCPVVTYNGLSVLYVFPTPSSILIVPDWPPIAGLSPSLARRSSAQGDLANRVISWCYAGYALDLDRLSPSQ